MFICLYIFLIALWLRPVLPSLVCNHVEPPEKVMQIDICDAWKMLVRDDGHTRRLAALTKTKCTWAPTERCCSPAEAVLVEE